MTGNTPPSSRTLDVLLISPLTEAEDPLHLVVDCSKDDVSYGTTLQRGRPFVGKATQPAQAHGLLMPQP